MACCVLAAILISQLIAIWKAQKLRIVMAVLAILTSGVLINQADRHWDHYTTEAAYFMARLGGEDPAWSAVRQSGVVCATAAAKAPAAQG